MPNPPKRLMRVLVTTVPAAAKGGIVALHRTLFGSSGAEDRRIELFAFASADPFGESFADRLLRVFTGLCRFVFRLLRDPSLRVVHVNTAPDSKAMLRDALLVFAASFLGRRVLLQIHGTVQAGVYRGRARRAVSGALRRCSRILVFSRRDTEEVTGLVPGAAVDVFPNAVRADDFDGADASFRRDLLPAGCPLLVLCVCRMIREKGVFDLLEAVPTVTQEFPGAAFVLAGDGPVLGELRETVARRDLAATVRLPGHLPYEDVCRAMTASDVFVLPTYYMEGMPTAILQAMAAGLPVVTTPAGGIPEVIRDGVDGFLVPPRDVAALSRRIADLLRDEAMRKRMGAANAARVRTEFDAPVVRKELERLYRDAGSAV